MVSTGDDRITALEDEVRGCRARGDRQGLAVALGRLALLLRRQGDLGPAMERLAEQESLCVELGARGELAGSLGNQALILMDWGDDDAAAFCWNGSKPSSASSGTRPASRSRSATARWS